MEENAWEKFVRLIELDKRRNEGADELLVATDDLAETWMRTGDCPPPSELLEVDGFLTCINSDNRLLEHQLASLLMIAIRRLDAETFNWLRIAGLRTSALLKLVQLKWHASTSPTSFLLMWPNVEGHTRREEAGIGDDLLGALLDLSVELTASSNSSIVDKKCCLSLWLTMMSTMKELLFWNSFLRNHWHKMRSLLLTFLPSTDGYMVRISMQILSTIMSLFIQDTVHKRESLNEEYLGFEEILSAWNAVAERVERLPSRWFGGVAGPQKDACSVSLLLLIPLQVSALCPHKFDSVVGLPWFLTLLNVSAASLVASFSDQDEYLFMLLYCSTRIFKPERRIDCLHPVALWLQFFESVRFNEESIFEVLISGDYSLLAFLFFLKLLNNEWENLVDSPERISVYEWIAGYQENTAPEPAFRLRMVEIIDGQSVVRPRPVYPMVERNQESDCQVPYSSSKIPLPVLMGRLKQLLINLRVSFSSTEEVRPGACLKLIDKALSLLAIFNCSVTDSG